MLQHESVVPDFRPRPEVTFRMERARSGAEFPRFRYDGEYIRDFAGFTRLVWLTEEQAIQILGGDVGQAHHLRQYMNKCFTQITPGTVVYNHDGQFGLYVYVAHLDHTRERT